jgi:LacI family transcriptional regulator
MTTMADVAKRAGVSLSTVSHVVNCTRLVSPETTNVVRTAIDDLGYTPNVIARALVRASTNTVGLAMSLSTNYYFQDIVAAIEKACAAMGQMVLITDTANDPELELAAVKELAQRRVDGVILAPSASNDNAAIRFLRNGGLPFVLVDRLIGDDNAGVALENTEAMESLIDHLAKHGHTRIALVAGEPGLRSTIERTVGFQRAMARHRLEIDPFYIHAGNATSDHARAATRALFALPQPPTAIASGNNLSTIGVMKALRELKLRVPDDVALIGFDDFEWADCFEPRLTVIAQPSEMIGTRTAELLLERIRDPQIPPVPVRLPGKLVIRCSCGCAE